MVRLAQGPLVWKGVLISKDLRFNERIRVSPVRLIGEDGEQLGVVPVEEAREKARDANLDLVEVAPTADPPVCKLMDYGKFKYRQRKRVQHVIQRHLGEVKAIRLGGPRTEEHDLLFKLRDVRKFLELGRRVQVSVRFRGAQMRHAELGQELLRRCADELSDIAKVEQTPRMEGRRMSMTLIPKPGGKPAGGSGGSAQESAEAVD